MYVCIYERLFNNIIISSAVSLLTETTLSFLWLPDDTFTGYDTKTQQQFSSSVHRYVAVCEPLRYHTIMTPARLHACCTVAWSTAVVCITVLFGLHANTPLCGNVIQHVYCTNRGILSLACKSTPANNIYG